MEPRPISLTQIDEAEYTSDLAPVPFVVVGPVPGGGGGGGGSTAWADITGKPSTYPPSAHTQGISTITGLSDALAGKASTADLDNTFGIAQEAHQIADEANGKASTAVQPAQIANLVPNTRTVAGKPLSSNVELDKVDVGLASVDNTSDANKPVSTAQQSAINARVPNTRTVAGRALSADIPRAGLNTLGLGEAVFIPKNGTVPNGTPTYTIVIEAEA